MKKSILLLAALVAPSIVVAQEPRPVSLQEAVDLARRNAPGMISARGQLRTSAMALRVAKWAAFNPLNNLNFSYSSSIGGGGRYNSEGVYQQVNPSSWGFQNSFGGAQFTLWDGGRKFADISRQRAAVEQAESNEVQQRYQIAANVKQQYYSILSAIESRAAALSQIAQAEQQLKAAIARLRAGTAVISDSLTATVTLGSARLALLTAENNAANASAQLTRLTGSDFPVTAIVSDTTDPPALPMTNAELMALAEQGPTVRTSMAQVASQHATEKSTRAQYIWPAISMNGSYSRSNSEPTRGGFTGYDFGAGKMNYSWGFGISASFPLWNGYVREQNMLTASINTDNAEANLREAKLTARQNITQQVNSLRTAEAQLVIARGNFVAAQEALRVQTQRYEIGAGALLDVLNAQNQLNSTRSSLITQRFTLRNTRAAIETLIGRELPQ